MPLLRLDRCAACNEATTDHTGDGINEAIIACARALGAVAMADATIITPKDGNANESQCSPAPPR